jgi:hypothetical protein
MKLWDLSDDIAQVNHKNTKKKEKNGEFFFHKKRGDPIPEYLWLMPKLFKHVNCQANVIKHVNCQANVILAFDKPCIPLKTCRKMLFTSRNRHDKNVWEWSHFLGIGMDFQVKEWCFLLRNGLHHLRYVCK